MTWCYLKFKLLSETNSTSTWVWSDKVITWTTTNPPPHLPKTFKALPHNLGRIFLVCNLILTQLEEIWSQKYGSYTKYLFTEINSMFKSQSIQPSSRRSNTCLNKNQSTISHWHLQWISKNVWFRCKQATLVTVNVYCHAISTSRICFLCLVFQLLTAQCFCPQLPCVASCV